MITIKILLKGYNFKTFYLKYIAYLGKEVKQNTFSAIVQANYISIQLEILRLANYTESYNLSLINSFKCSKNTIFTSSFSKNLIPKTTSNYKFKQFRKLMFEMIY